MSVVEDSRLAQSQQSELVRREKEATQAVKKLEADLFAERADHSRQVMLSPQLEPVPLILELKRRRTVCFESICENLGNRMRWKYAVYRVYFSRTGSS